MGAKKNFVISLVMVVFSALFLFIPMFTKAAPTTDSMLGYWKFDTDGVDNSGGGNVGSLLYGSIINPAFPTASKFQNTGSLNFPSLSSEFQITNTVGISPSDRLSFSAWMMFSNMPTMTNQIAGNYNGSDITRGFYFSVDATNFYFHVGNSGVVHFPMAGNISAGNWFHITGIWDGTNIILYLNGNPMGTVAYAGGIDYTGTSFYLGNFLGNIDEVRLYNRVLGTTEIAALTQGEYTSAVWIGDLGTNYESPQNWNIGAVPDPYTIIGIPNTINKPEFTQSESVAGIKILADSSLNIHSFNLNINSSEPILNDGSFILSNADTQTINGFINDTNSGSVVIEGSETGVQLKTGSSYYDLTMNGTGSVLSLPAALVVYGNLNCNSGNFSIQNSLSVGGNILLGGGTLTALGANTINLHGNWLGNMTSSFIPGSSTINLSGGNQSISGNNTFYNLSNSSSTAETITFQSGSTQTVQNYFYLHGTAGAVINLRASTPGTQWRINSLGTNSFEYLDVMDSNNIGALFDVSGLSVADSGNNLNWTFDIISPNIALGSVDPVTTNLLYPVTGAVSDVNFISGVSFRIDLSSTWIPCVADDGLFDSIAESFTCTPNANLSEGQHTFYVRATDVYSNMTPIGNYQTAVFTVNAGAPQLVMVSSGGQTNNNLFPVSGTATDLNGVQGVEFYLDGGSAWAPCQANDGGFGGNSEIFTCTPGSALIDGAHTFYIRATDSYNTTINTANYSTVSFYIDTVVPNFNSVSSTPDNSSVLINWTTSEASSSMVEYGTNVSYGQLTTEQDIATPVYNHNVSISGLSVCTTYHFRTISRDLALNQNIGSDQIFTTGGCATSNNTNTTSSSSSCDKDKPGEPEITSIDVDGEDSVTLNIDEASGDDDEYDIKYGKSNDNYEWSVEDIDKDDIDTYEIGDLSPGVTYYFKVRAKNDCEKGDWSDYESAKTKERIVYQNQTTTPSTVPTTKPIDNEIENNSTISNSTTSENVQSNLDNNEEESRFSNVSKEKEADNDKSDKSKSKADIKKIEVPVSEDYSAASVEMFNDSYGRKRLKISGFGPPNTELKVYVYSDDPVVLAVKTDSDGNWSYILDNELEDGEHQVYVALTEEDGQVKGKSNPLVFIKTAQAISVISEQPVSPMEKAKKRFLIFSIVISALAILLAILIIGWRIRTQKIDERAIDGHIG